MKRFLLIGLLFLGLDSSVSYAQSRGTHRDATYQDDIYYNSEDAKKDAEIEAKEAKKRQAYDRENENSYASSGGDASDGGGSKSYNRSYESDDEGYIDYDDDDYYYSNRIRRFNNPYWGFGYYTPFYNPYWYDPFYGPYSYGPTVSISFGWGNPYWGWNTWYGYPGFYSCWNYPHYGYGWGGNYWNGYYNGFYDGYYAGAYGGGYYRNVTYGPRTSLHRGAATGVRRSVGFNNNVQPSTGPRPQLRRSMDNNSVVENPGRPVRSSSDRNTIEYRGGANEAVQGAATDRFENRSMQAEPQRETSRRSRFFNNSEDGSVEDARSATPQREMPRRNRFFNNNQAGSNVENARPQYNEGRRAQGFEQQAPVMRAQPNYERQNYQRAQPSYESPRMSAPNYSAPQRGGGSNFGGGSFGGGRRR